MTAPLVEPAAPPDPPGGGGLDAVPGVVRLRLGVAYDGTDFHGWARQPGLRSVQGEIESALRAVLRVPDYVPVRAAVAGRTDAGVHATGQVCHADVPGASLAGSSGQPSAPLEVVRRRLNGALPHDVRVREVGVAPEGFDARWSATWRRYSYLVADDPRAQDPRARGHVLWSGRSLDVAAMHRAAQPFLGEHDFAAYCRAREGASTVRTVHELAWRRWADPGPPVVEFVIRADAFCHAMVRSLVGAFMAVGVGRWPAGRPAELLGAGERVPAVAAAPAHGLTLVEVGYPEQSDLAAQALRARRWRGR